jgi:hypothetical protein
MIMDDVTLANNITVTEQRPVVCIIGTLRAVDLTYQNLIEKVIQPLNADLMFCVSRMTSEDETTLNKFRSCNIVDICIYEEAKDNYEDFLQGFFSRLTPEKQSEWHKYFDIEGNWLGGIKGRRGSGFHLNFNYLKLLDRLQHFKEIGSEYQRFVITRTDLFWMVEHPPLNLLDSKFIWIPTGENYNGYNDRHAVCSNQNVSDYLSLLEFMLNLKALEYIYNNLDENNLNHERHLKSHLDYCGVKVANFKNVAYLTGDQQDLTNWAPVKTKSVDGVEYAYKYEKELLSSLENMKQFAIDKNWGQMIFEREKESN